MRSGQKGQYSKNGQEQVVNSLVKEGYKFVLVVSKKR